MKTKRAGLLEGLLAWLLLFGLPMAAQAQVGGGCAPTFVELRGGLGGPGVIAEHWTAVTVLVPVGSIQFITKLIGTSSYRIGLSRSLPRTDAVLGGPFGGGTNYILPEGVMWLDVDSEDSNGWGHGPPYETLRSWLTCRVVPRNGSDGGESNGNWRVRSQ